MLGCPVSVSGVGIERVFTSDGKQYDDLKKRITDKMLEIILETGMNTKLKTGDVKGVFTGEVLEITQTLSDRLKLSAPPSVESPCHGIRDPSSIWIFSVSEKVVSQKTKQDR